MNKTIRFLLLSDTFFISGFGLILPILSVYIKENLEGGTLLASGIAAALFLLTKSCVQIPFSKYVDNENESFDLFWLIMGGLITLIVPAVYILSTTVTGIYIAQFLYGVGAGLSYPTWLKLWNNHLDIHHEAFEWSFYSSSVSLSTALAGIVGAWISNTLGFAVTFAAVGAVSFFGFLSLGYLRYILLHQKKQVQGVTLDFPELRQTYNYDCGASAMESVLVYYGIEMREDTIMKQAKTNSSEGTAPEDMLRVFKKFGLKTLAREMTLEDIKKFIRNGIPVIVLLQAWTEHSHVNWKKDWDDGHYVVAIGYDDAKIYFEDPSSFERTYLTFDELRQRWHDTAKGKKYYNFGIAVYGKKPKFSEHKILHMN